MTKVTDGDQKDFVCTNLYMKYSESPILRDFQDMQEVWLPAELLSPQTTYSIRHIYHDHLLLIRSILLFLYLFIFLLTKYIPKYI